ncbi:hypothetical protein Z968_08180 [Clostridium novyi A str. 4552]|uniref:PPC domain-containing protein n=1 Tax=Clostridium novyi A str. 4552 TaxID=1444289 RepID=A0A0A0I691_CLONO|nr:PPC domain-containing DNA-binding protein [Clostridium novyi]KGM95816.1 hypothetical protein Z968_08180 [Clostridium novyi A str. 4552]
MKYSKRGSTWAIVLEKGEKITESIKKFCGETGIKAGIVNAIGAAKDIKIGYFNVNTKEYNETTFGDYYEITSLTGDVSTKDRQPYTHIHINFAGGDCVGYGGHFIEGTITVTCEMFITEIEGELERIPDTETGINVIKL